VLAGAILFHASRDPRMSRTRSLSCASCHMDGGDDGLTWDFTQRGEGLRNTIPLRGRGAGHGPIHWSGNFDEIQDFEHDIRGGQGGTGFLPDDLFHAGTRDTTLGDPKAGLSPELDALAAYVASLDRYGVSPARRDGDAAWESARARGEAIFVRGGCEGCHTGTRGTDSAFVSPGTPRLHDVGTLGPGSGMRLGGALSGLDTPTLRGLWASAPYLHDGSAPTLRAVLRDRNPDDRHGTTSTLSDAELDDLETYLLSLDDR
jgi:cytochrome c peroxidase